MKGKVLVLTDTLDLKSEVFSYALELASRTGSSLFILIILPLGETGSRVPNAEWRRNAERAVMECLNPHATAARAAGVKLEAILKHGVPSSEVIKFLAESSAVHTIVWGGERSLVSERARSKKVHWLAQIRDRPPCPVVIPVSKSGEDEAL